jgi:hypothetical protein
LTHVAIRDSAASPFDQIMEFDTDGHPGLKRCPRCGERKPSTSFSANKRRTDGLAFYCKTCHADFNRQNLFGMTREQYAELLGKQNGRCAICSVAQADKRLTFAVDHDHACCAGERSCGQCVRGLLCDACNRAIGFMGDSPERLRSAADYLEVFRVSPDNPIDQQRLVTNENTSPAQFELGAA